MKNILKSSVLLLCGLALFTACKDDNGSNPTFKAPTQFVLNTPALANTPIDLANCEKIVLTCSQPDYGFPASTSYIVQVATKQDMSDMVELSSASTSAKVEIDAAELAAKLTDLSLAANEQLTEEDFPIDLPVYFRLRAYMTNTDGKAVEGSEILSNIVSLNNVHLEFSLAPVTAPEHLYIVGQFCSWDWNKCVEMVHVWGAPDVFWHMVYIDNSGIKFNTNMAWDGGECGFDQINIVEGDDDLHGDIISGDGNIASSNPGWYLMIVTCSVQGRDIIYDVQFRKPEVWLIGWIYDGDWTELKGDTFTVPDGPDGYFVSPLLDKNLPGTESEGCVRAYCKIPGFDWWKSEFMVYDGKLVYRGAGDDQERVGCSAGQYLYLNFTTEEGEIKFPD
ncbi:MAG: SusF/SusE family outer membrane protein [Muribaculaceae bacterium]|nr:SusF/SusE family outer membrane protein [Muribaculaceae bacterium]